MPLQKCCTAPPSNFDLTSLRIAQKNFRILQKSKNYLATNYPTSTRSRPKTLLNYPELYNIFLRLSQNCSQMREKILLICQNFSTLSQYVFRITTKLLTEYLWLELLNEAILTNLIDSDSYNLGKAVQAK